MINANLIIVLLVATINISIAWEESTYNALIKCQKKHNMDDTTTKNLSELESLPNTQEAKCFAACWMEELEILKDGQLNKKAIEKLTPPNFINDEARKKNIEGSYMCFDQSKATDNCEIAYEIATCYMDYIKKNNLKEHIYQPDSQQ
ncbi:hypothetical protein O3M35_000055 [Rhynocoris fuscipes]|uniref:Uncharacterized protein n=1 Tax=Rhynocoris fuscipes TaxID=488301 RepID=A0AAW1DNT7_9HEMI